MSKLSEKRRQRWVSRYPELKKNVSVEVLEAIYRDSYLKGFNDGLSAGYWRTWLSQTNPDRTPSQA